MRFLINLVLLPIKLLLLPLWVFGAIIKLVLGLGFGLFAVVASVVGVFLFIFLLPLTIVGSLFGGGFGVLLLIAAVVAIIKFIPQVESSVSRFMSH